MYKRNKNLESLRKDEIHINSENTAVSNELQWVHMKKSITKEFKFFQREYFEARDDGYNVGPACISLYYSGHAEIGYLATVEPVMTYINFFKHIVAQVDTHTKSLGVDFGTYEV